MSRRNFLRNAGIGAAGLVGAAMLGSSASFAKKNNSQQEYKIGVMGIGPSIPPYQPVGTATYDVISYVLEEQGRKLNVTFTPIFGDCTCGDAFGEGVTAFTDFLKLKQDGVKFFLGPNCTTSAVQMVGVPQNYDPDAPNYYSDPREFRKALKQYENAWKDTTVISPTADGYANKVVGEDNRAFFMATNGVTYEPLRYRVVGVSASDKAKPVGALICEHGYSDVGIVYQENEDFVQSLVDGISSGLAGCGVSPAYYISPNTVAGYQGKIKKAIDENKQAIAFACFGSDEGALIKQAVNNLLEAGYTMPALYGTSEVGVISGMWTATVILDESPGGTGTINGKDWTAYDNAMAQAGVDWSFFAVAFGDAAAPLYVAQIVEAAYILSELVVAKKGNTYEVNKALDYGTYPAPTPYTTGFFKGVTWNANVFPVFNGGILDTEPYQYP